MNLNTVLNTPNITKTLTAMDNDGEIHSFTTVIDPNTKTLKMTYNGDRARLTSGQGADAIKIAEAGSRIEQSVKTDFASANNGASLTRIGNL